MSEVSNPFLLQVTKNAQEFGSKEIIRTPEGSLTWNQLIERAHQYAGSLKDSQAEIVPIFVDRSFEVPAAVLGCLFAGKAFAPISPDQPEERWQRCFSKAQADIFISTSHPESVEVLGGIPRAVPGAGEKAPLSDQAVESLMYVLFTSGSTGEPKGVMVSYDNILNTLEWGKETLDWNDDDVIGCATNFFFDISVFDLLTSFYWNIPMAIYSDSTNMGKVIAETKQMNISSVFAAPVFFSQLLRGGGLGQLEGSSLRRIISGGDFFPPQHILKWQQELPQVTVWNVWGPTETSIVNTMHPVGPEDQEALQKGEYPPVGRPTQAMPLVIVDEKGQEISEPGVKGEIWMLDRCVTQGYLKDPEKTQFAYVSFNGRRAFRTQDIGFWDQSGNVHMVGRMGSLVKISGYRVELGEVESAATRCPEVLLAGAFVKDGVDGTKELCIGVEASDKTAKFDVFSFKKQLRALLPNYMVPKKVVVLDEIPKNANGKINRKEMTQMT